MLKYVKMKIVRGVRCITGGTWSLEKVDGSSADHGADMVLDRANASTRYQTSEFLRMGRREKNILVVVRYIRRGRKISFVDVRT
jgi:hypothetical protein